MIITLRNLLLLAVIVLGTVQANFSQTSKHQAQLLSPRISTTVVINEVYGGAGCGTAGCSTYQNDYIELYNNGTTAVDLTGYSVQYASATGTAWQITTLTGSIPAGGYYLVAEGAGLNGVNPLPTPNVSGSIAMSATAAKVALVNSTTSLTGACPTGTTTIVDFVAYGATSNCAEVPTGTASGSSTLAAGIGQGAPAPSTTTSAQRTGGTDTDRNSTDFTVLAPNPQNSVPTAATVSISGQVLAADGTGLTNARVTLTDSNGNTRTILTKKLGAFRFDDVEVGAVYIITVGSRRYTFAPQIISVTENLAEINFTAQEASVLQ